MVLPTNLGTFDYVWAVSYRNVALTAGTPARFTAGTGCVTVTGPHAANATKCGVEIQTKQTTNFDLAALNVTYDTTATGPLARDFGPTPLLRVFRTQDPVAPATTGTEVIFAQAQTALDGGRCQNAGAPDPRAVTHARARRVFCGCAFATSETPRARCARRHRSALLQDRRRPRGSGDAGTQADLLAPAAVHRFAGLDAHVDAQRLGAAAADVDGA